MIDTKTYFKNIDAWPHEGRKIGVGYVTGFIGSLLCTVIAFMFAMQGAIPRPVVATTTILLLACVQFFIQMRYFLHIDFKPSSRTKLFTLGFAVVIVAILVSGSVWIMTNLNSRMTPSTEVMTQYMQRQPGI